MTHIGIARGTIVALVIVAAGLLVAGCSGEYGPTLPSPEGEAGDICGTVTDGDGQPVADATVTASNGSEQYTATTDANGHYCLHGLSEANYAMSFARTGFATVYRTAQFDGTLANADAEMTEEVGTNPDECPVIDVTATGLDEDAGTVRVTGTVGNTDSDTVIIFQDGQPTVAGLTEGALDQLVFLHPGTNVLRVFVANAGCARLGEPIEVEWTPPAGADFFFRVTLTWDTPTADPDLHVWSPGVEQHVAYWNQSIDAGTLDVDDTEGYGPENFTCTTSDPGRFRVAVNSFDLDEDPSTRCTIRVVTGGLASGSLVRSYGPHAFSSSNAEQGYPVTADTANWWRPVDIILGSDGSVAVTSADRESLPRDPAGVLSAAAVPVK